MKEVVYSFPGLLKQTEMTNVSWLLFSVISHVILSNGVFYTLSLVLQVPLWSSVILRDPSMLASWSPTWSQFWIVVFYGPGLCWVLFQSWPRLQFMMDSVKMAGLCCGFALSRLSGPVGVWLQYVTVLCPGIVTLWRSRPDSEVYLHLAVLFFPSAIHHKTSTGFRFLPPCLTDLRQQKHRKLTSTSGQAGHAKAAMWFMGTGPGWIRHEPQFEHHATSHELKSSVTMKH